MWNAADLNCPTPGPLCHAALMQSRTSRLKFASAFDLSRARARTHCLATFGTFGGIRA